MSWWVWIVAGFGLAALEVIAPAWVFLGFALGAGGVGAVLWLGGGMGIAGQLLLFAMLSLAGWGALRAFLGVPRGQVKRIERDINDN